MAAGLGPGGWSLLEYGLHRFLFHARSRRLARMVWIIHDKHHQEPDDRERDVMPLAASLPVALPIYAAFLWLGSVRFGNLLAGFAALGYVTYDCIHYGTHQIRPRTAIGRMLRRHHLRHHHAAREGNYGVSSPLWDLVFGTHLNRRA